MSLFNQILSAIDNPEQEASTNQLGSIEDYQKLNLPQTSLSEALMLSIIEQDLDFSRDQDTGRDINF